MAAAADSPVALPSAPSFHAAPNILVQPPLSRRGAGPGLVLLVADDLPLAGHDRTLDPPPLLKWAEEGYAVAQISLPSSHISLPSAHISLPSAHPQAQLRLVADGFAAMPECTAGPKYAVISYLPRLPQPVLAAIEDDSNVVALVNYGSEPLNSRKPQLWHRAGESTQSGFDSSLITVHSYADAKPLFVLPAHDHYRGSAAAVSHTRTLAFLKPLLGGPYFDLEAIWEEHCRYEFHERAVAKTMGTMVQEPYVNHMPTITGGIGRARLTRFYADHFVHCNPPDTSLELVTRTVGIDRVVDEFVFKCTHDRMVGWLVPGVPPTGKKLEVPFTSVINIRGDRLFHEHIAWDQATLLMQLGLLPEYLPFPYQVNGKDPAPGKRFEYRLPVAGIETARKLVDENSVESNEMFKFDIREVDV